jgi:hypothetical protein
MALRRVPVFFGGDVARGDDVRLRGSNWWSDNEGDRARLLPEEPRAWFPIVIVPAPELTERIVDNCAPGVLEGGDPGVDAIRSGEEGRAPVDFGEVLTPGEPARRVTGV